MKLTIERQSRDYSILKIGVLIWLTFQNSIHTLLIRYARARDIPQMFISSVAVFLTEIFKAFVCIFIVIYEEGSFLK